MKGTRAALRYAKATLNLAKDKGLAKEVNDDMLLITQTINENHDLLVLLKSPIVKATDKKNVLSSIFKSKTNPITLGVINLLIENKRIELLPLVAKEYVIIYDFLKGIEIAHVTTAVPLTKELEAKILNKIKEFSNNDISFENKIDPSIIGGFILRVGDKQLDSSVSGQLKGLLSNFEDNHYVSKL